MKINACTTDRFRKAYRQYTNKEQKQIDEAIDSWLNSHDNKGSNFEKLGFMGDNIFSIRVNQAGRIIMTKFDDIYFLLHVDIAQHDKVNDWAKNKKIERNSITGAIQIYNVNVEEVEQQFVAQEEAMEDKGPFEEITEEDLLTLGIPSTWIDTVRKVKTDEQYMSLWDVLPEDALENLEVLYDGSVDIKILLAQVRDEIEKQPETIIEQIKIQPGFHVIGDDTSLIDAMSEDISLFRFYLHPTQKVLAYGDFKGPMKVTGGAGTGKTVVALHRAKHLLEKLDSSDKPIFFTTYTNYLIKNINSIFESQDFDKGKLKISNLHQFAFEYAKEIELFDEKLNIITQSHEQKRLWKAFVRKNPQIKWEPEFLRLEYENVIQRFHVTTLEDYKKINRLGRQETLAVSDRESVWNALKDYEAYQRYSKNYTFDDVIFQLNKYLDLWPEYRPFSHIICDEIQDFSNLEMRLLRNLVEEKPNDLFLCGDPFQNIYQRKFRFSQSGINIRGKRSTRLKINYRTTEEIRQFAVQMLEGFDFEDFSGQTASTIGDTSLVHGQDPTYINFENEQEEYNYILKYVRESFGELGLHEICLAARTVNQVDALYDYLNDKNIPIIKLQDVDDLSETKGKVVICTLHGLKGLEFKNLLVFGFNKESFPFSPRGFNNWPEEKKQDFIKAEHALMYVAFSRAISNLVITGVGERVEM